MVKDHAAADAKVLGLANKQSIKISEVAEANAVSEDEKRRMQEHESEVSALNNASGAEFEKLYIAAMAKRHQGVLTLLESAKPKDKYVESLVQTLLPTIRKHLARAQELQNTSTPAP